MTTALPAMRDYVEELAPGVGIALACLALHGCRATFYRHRAGESALPLPALPASTAILSEAIAPAVSAPAPKRRSPLRLAEEEREAVRAVLFDPRFIDRAPRTIHATLLDEGHYLGSVSTFYRVLREDDASRERRDQLAHPAYVKPELLATGVNQVWSWDITKLKGPAKWSYFYLYVILDIFSRYAVGWMVAMRECGELAKGLIATCLQREQVPAHQLTLHADRGGPMKAKPLALLLTDLGVAKSHSRPHTSDDNPFSEAQFKTLKYRPDFPQRFDSLEHARSFCQHFFDWYNTEHRHSGIGFVTPQAMHHGLAPAIHAQREMVLAQTFAAHPERFKGKLPVPPALPTAAGINWPKPEPQPCTINSPDPVSQSH